MPFKMDSMLEKTPNRPAVVKRVAFFVGIILLLSGAAYFAAKQLMQAGTVIGTISNQATLKYTDASSTQKTIQSNIVTASYIGGISDTTSPVLSGGAPTGVLVAGTVTATLKVTTNENANCKYGTASAVYDSLPLAFLTTGGIAHSSPVSSLANGTSYQYFVRCKDAAGNATNSDYIVSFSVAAPASGGSGSSSPDVQAPTGTINLNHDAVSTTAKNVTLYLSASDNTGGSGIGMMRFSNDGNSWSSWQTFVSTKGWNITAGYGGNRDTGAKTVYAQFKDNAGNISTAYSDSINYTRR